MDKPNYVLDFIVPGCSSGCGKPGHLIIPQERSHITCFCCLATNVPFVNAWKCSHTEFVKFYFKMKSPCGLWICCICHYMLKKIELFRLQVYKSFNNLKKKESQGNSNWKLLNELTKENMSNIDIMSIVKSEPENATDPLEVSNTNLQQDIEIKLEPEFDCNTNMEQTDICEHSIQTYTHTHKPSINTSQNTHTETSQNVNLLNMINLTPIRHKSNEFVQTYINTNVQKDNSSTIKDIKRTDTTQNLNLMKMINVTPSQPQRKENPLLKTMLSTEGPFSIQNYIKILPKSDNSTKSKAPKPVIRQVTCIDNKSADVKEKQDLAKDAAKETVEIQEKQDDKIYSLLHKPSSVIDSSYEGKIMQHTITQEELEKERYEERNKEYFRTAKYKCDSCVRVFDYEFTMDRHNHKQHKEADANLETVCLVCKCVYSKAAYKNHFKKHFTRFVCLVCEEYSTDLPKLALHYNQSHPDKEPIPLSYWCNECHFKTDAILIYRQHRKTHRTQKCNICNKVIYVKMRIHMKSHHSEATASKKTTTMSTKSYKCEHCDRTYVLPSTLRNHVKMCHSDDTNTYYCEKCDKQFKTETSYRGHLRQSSAHANIDEVFKYICDFCGKKTKYKDVMESHIEREHLKTMRFKCELCNKIFGSDKFLQRHINFVHNKHQLPKNKICQYCGKAFAAVSTLRTHIRKHTGERPLKCDICEMTFAHSGSLYTHRRLKHKIPRKRELIASKNESY